jgi:hypothetical protein
VAFKDYRNLKLRKKTNDPQKEMLKWTWDGMGKKEEKCETRLGGIWNFS